MNKTRLSALAATFACSLVFPTLSFAQDGFPDTAQNHWAFDALARLKKDGLIVGYPDGMFRGGRPSSRYEMAAAVHAAYLALRTQTDGLASAASALNEKASHGDEVTKADLDSLKASLSAVQAKLDGMKGVGDDTAAIKKMFDEFQKELEAMGVNVHEARQSLDNLAARVDALEKRKLPIDIRGELNFVAFGGFSLGNEFGITVDGRPTGIGHGSYGPNQHDLDHAAHVGITRDLTVLNEMAMSFMDNKPDPLWRFTVVTGNMVGAPQSGQGFQTGGFGNQSNAFPTYGFQEAGQSFYLQNAAVKFEGSTHGQPYRVEMGRFDHRISPYVFQRPDATPYFSNERWDNGLWSVDGAMIRFGEGSKKLTLFAGRPSNSYASNGAVVQQMTAVSGLPFLIGQGMPSGVTGGTYLPISEVAGVDLKFPFLKTGEGSLAYVSLRSNTVQPIILNSPILLNGAEVFGASLRGTVAGIFPVHADWTKSNVVYNSSSVTSHDNEATDIGITSDKGKLGFKAGYRMIGPNFGAPGDWGRIGMWWNPTNVNETYFKPRFGVGGWTVEATTHYVTGQGKGGGAPSPLFVQYVDPMTKDDHTTNVGLSLTHNVGSGLQGLVGVESADWHFADRSSTIGYPAVEVHQRWYDFGITMTHELTTWNVLLQISDYRTNGNSGFAPFGNNSSQQTGAHGGLLTTQISTRF